MRNRRSGPEIAIALYGTDAHQAGPISILGTQHKPISEKGVHAHNARGHLSCTSAQNRLVLAGSQADNRSVAHDVCGCSRRPRGDNNCSLPRLACWRSVCTTRSAKVGAGSTPTRPLGQYGTW